MASQFQHRVVGAVVLVALGVIILPGVLDGDKKYYQNEFAAIPIIPAVEDNHATTELPPASQALPDVVPDSGMTANQTNNDTTIVGTDSSSAGVSNVDNNISTNTVTNNNTVDNNNTSNTSNTSNNNNATAQNSNQTTTNQTTPKGKAYVVQLGAFKNVEGIAKIRAQLSFANYTVFTIPAKPIQGQTTRIFVGPDASRQKLQAALPELERLTGLKGVVREHNITN